MLSSSGEITIILNGATEETNSSLLCEFDTAIHVPSLASFNVIVISPDVDRISANSMLTIYFLSLPKGSFPYYLKFVFNIISFIDTNFAHLYSSFVVSGREIQQERTERSSGPSRSTASTTLFSPGAGEPLGISDQLGPGVDGEGPEAPARHRNERSRAASSSSQQQQQRSPPPSPPPPAAKCRLADSSASAPVAAKRQRRQHEPRRTRRRQRRQQQQQQQQQQHQARTEAVPAGGASAAVAVDGSSSSSSGTTTTTTTSTTSVADDKRRITTRAARRSSGETKTTPRQPPSPPPPTPPPPPLDRGAGRQSGTAGATMKLLARFAKLRERLFLGLAGLAILATFLLVMDLQMDLGYSGHHLLPSHGRIKVAEDQQVDGFYNSFRRKYLQQKMNASKEAASGAEPTSVIEPPAEVVEGPGRPVPVKHGPTTTTTTTTKAPPRDDFHDLGEYAGKIAPVFANDGVVRISEEEDSDNPTIGQLKKIEIGEESSLLEKFHWQISRRELYPEDSKLVPKLLDFMATQPIVHSSQKSGGTQLKLVIEYPSKVQALFKPMRFPREQQTLPNHFYFTDYERHNAEIAAFHLDRLLGFRRCMPVVGRLVNITTEIFQVMEGDILKTFFISPAGNLCFHGKCSYYCDTGHAICGSPDVLEGSFAAFLPEKDQVARKVWRHPWRRSYHKRLRAQWETDADYCNIVRELPPYNEGRRLLDLMDMSIFDFLTGNMDRHHYETFSLFGNNTFTLHLDNGRAFGKAFHDELSCLSPLVHCCLIRQSTLSTLLRYHNGPIRLSRALSDSMLKDPLAPILWEPHLAALDRRLPLILQAVRDCINRSSHWTEVVKEEKSEQSDADDA